VGAQSEVRYLHVGVIVYNRKLLKDFFLLHVIFVLRSEGAVN